MSSVDLGVLRAQLRSVLREAVDPRLDYVSPPGRLGGGAFSANYVFELDRAPSDWSGRLVLRFVAGSGLAVLIEAGLQEGARQVGVAAPRVLHVEPAAEVLGAPFIVMEFLSGRGFLGGIEWYRFARDFPKMLWSWPATFADACALLGRADTGPVLDALARRGVPRNFSMTTRHLGWIDATIGEGCGFEEAVAWLKENEPRLPDRLCLVHGDLWPANVLMDHSGICGLVDWTMGAVGDPALDVGFAKVGLALMPEPFPPPAPIRNVVNSCGVRMARRIDLLCAPLVGGVDRVAYFEALRCLLQITVVHADRRAGRNNGWEHGMQALLRHFNRITGLNVHSAQHPL